MTPLEALRHLVCEFTCRFGEDAEGCCDSGDTNRAIETIANAFGTTRDAIYRKVITDEVPCNVPEEFAAFKQQVIDIRDLPEDKWVI
jgi:hypothetical protein